MTTFTDHRQARTIRTQEHTKALKLGFYRQQSTKKTKKHRKNSILSVGVVEAASFPFSFFCGFVHKYTSIRRNDGWRCHKGNNPTNWNLLFQYFFAPSTFIAFRTFQVTSCSSVHCHHCFFIGGHNLVTAIFALVSAHTDLKL